MAGDALVLNAAGRQSLVAIRCLGRRGISTTAGSYRRVSPGGLSKYADRHFTHPTPWERPEAFAAALADEVRTGDYDSLLLSDDATAEVVMEHRDELGDHIGLPYPAYDLLRVALDKGRTVDAARDVGLPHPTTLAADEVDRAAIESTLSYPIVVKPRQSQGREGVCLCHSFEELARTFPRVRRRHGPALLQEFIPNGGEIAVYAMYDDSGLRAATVQERIRSYPPEGGASTYRRTVTDPDLLSSADDLLSSLGWRGPAMVEFRVDPRDGEPKLMEINPRLWGSLALSVAAGVDFPHLMYQLGAEGRCDEVQTYRPGVYARNLVGEVAHVAARRDRYSAAREVCRRSPGPCSFDVLSLDDPLPAVGYLWESASAWLQ